MANAEIQIILPPDGTTTIEGPHVVVFIGPNGAGKTRYGKELSDRSGGTRIPALRSLAFEEKIRPRDAETARQEASNKFAETSSVWAQVSLLDEMLAQLKAEDNEANSRLKRDTLAAKAYVEPEITNLDLLCSIWESIFPNRKLDFSGHKPQVTATHRGAAVTYNANTMSDGERAAIYLIASVLRAPAGLIVIDEPEVHFHGLLARTFWDKTEEARSDCRFVYITHDIPFALSRRGVQIGIVESDTQARLIPQDAGIPPEIVQDILGAASLSLVANTIIFTEGTPGSLDAQIYGSWFKTPGKIAVPVSNCRAVQEAVRVFGANPQIINNASFSGIIERDYLSDGRLATLGANPNLHVLPVNEVESLLCLRPVASAVARHMGVSDADFSTRYDSFEAEVRTTFTGARLNKQILERVKSEVEGRLYGLMHTASASADPAVVRAGLNTTASTAFASVDAGVIFDEHQRILSIALAQPADNFLRVLPGKDCLAILLRHLDLSQDAYVDLISHALAQSDGSEEPAFATLKQELIAALAPHLPAR